MSRRVIKPMEALMLEREFEIRTMIHKLIHTRGLQGINPSQIKFVFNGNLLYGSVEAVARRVARDAEEEYKLLLKEGMSPIQAREEVRRFINLFNIVWGKQNN